MSVTCYSKFYKWFSKEVIVCWVSLTFNIKHSLGLFARISDLEIDQLIKILGKLLNEIVHI